MKIKDFLIFKNKQKKHEKSPDYEITVKIDNKFIKIGGVWLRTGKNGDKFFSCKLSEGYKDISGFSLVRDVALAVGSNIPESEIPDTNNIPF